MLSTLHARAFGNPPPGQPEPWTERLQRHALSWVCAFDGPTLIGFVYACWDGRVHAFLLDPVVDPNYQRRGIGRALVQALGKEAAAAGCTWLHADYEPDLAAFYEEGLGYTQTRAGLVRLQ